MRLQELFPDIEAHEFTDACMRLVEQDALRLSKLGETLGGFPDDPGAHDNIAFFYTDPQMKFHLHAGPLSDECFKRLSAFIDMPPKFKRQRGAG